jgi:Fe-S-cluster containining protein
MPPLPAEDHFECLPGCGLCCSYRVLLTKTDLHRIQDNDASLERPITWLDMHAGEQALQREAGFCVFLDPLQRCKIYEGRPDHCRTYPYLKTAYHKPEIDVDLSCPGLGYGTGISESTLDASSEGGTTAGKLDAGVKEVEGLLQAQQRFASPDILASLGERAIEKLVEAWSSNPSVSLRVSQPSPILLNADSKAQETELWDELQWISLFPENLHTDAVWMDRHFLHPRWSTRLDGRDVTTYRFWIAEGIFYQEEPGQPLQDVALKDIDPLAWHADALAVRQAYLDRWHKRQLLIRLSSNLAVARLLQGDHLAKCYLQFLMEIDRRLAVLAPALARINGKRTIDHSIALEAVRGSDGLLRAWCESARLGISD